MALDVSKFKPTSANELFEGLVSVVKDVALEQWEKISDDLTNDFKFIAEKTAEVTGKLATHIIDVKQADATLHLLELNLNSTLRQFVFMTYVTAQKILTAVFNLLKSAIRNLTGVKLLF